MNNEPRIVLQIENIFLNFGGITALKDLSLSIRENDIFSIIGPNGAGKTSLFNCISGVYRPEKGRILFFGEEITGLRPHRIAEKGIGRTFQNIGLFRNMTLIENLMVGRHVRLRIGTLSLATSFFIGKKCQEEIKGREIIEELINFIGLEKWKNEIVGNVPFGIQKKVELVRALAMDPKILLLDEPCSGMNLEETEEIAKYILKIKEEYKKTIILVEHIMGIVMKISDVIAVLNFGCKVAEGSPKEIQRNLKVIEVYLGK